MRNDHGLDPARGVGVGSGCKAVGWGPRGQSAAQQREAAEGQRPEGGSNTGRRRVVGHALRRGPSHRPCPGLRTIDWHFEDGAAQIHVPVG